MLIERGSNYGPFEAALPAPEWRDRERGDAPLVQVRLEVLQPLDDRREAGDRAPVPLGGEVEDVRGRRPAVEVRTAKLHLPAGAPTFVVLVHVREALLERQGHALAHYAHRVDGVHERL